MATKIELIRAEDLSKELRDKEGITIDYGTLGLELSTGSVNREYKQVPGKFFAFLRDNAKKDGEIDKA